MWKFTKLNGKDCKMKWPAWITRIRKTPALSMASNRGKNRGEKVAYSEVKSHHMVGSKNESRHWSSLPVLMCVWVRFWLLSAVSIFAWEYTRRKALNLIRYFDRLDDGKFEKGWYGLKRKSESTMTALSFKCLFKNHEVTLAIFIVLMYNIYRTCLFKVQNNRTLYYLNWLCTASHIFSSIFVCELKSLSTFVSENMRNHFIS